MKKHYIFLLLLSCFNFAAIGQAWDSSTSGQITYSGNKVGIGTTTPFGSTNNSGLHIRQGWHSSILLGDPTNGHGGIIQTSDGKQRVLIGANLYDDQTNAWSSFSPGKGSAGISILADEDSWGTMIDFITSKSDGHYKASMKIDGDGYVGIGTDPIAPLDIKTSSGSLRFDALGASSAKISSTAALGLETTSTSFIQFLAAGTEIGRFTSSGLFGIGTPAPDEKLTIQGGHLNVGGTANGTIKARHLTGKSNTSTDYGDLFLQYHTTHPVRIGTTTNPAPVYIHGDVGVGTNTPGYKLDVDGDVHVGQKLRFYRQGIGATTFYMESNQNNASINVSSVSDYLTFNIGSGSPERMRISNSGKVGIGTTSPDELLTVKGTIHSEEVKVDLSVPGPDYVFEEDYDLRSLEETEAYIKANKHLPEIPSAKEMEANGVQLGEMNMLLLKKIEELTLYVIELKKVQDELVEENTLLRGKVDNKY